MTVQHPMSKAELEAELRRLDLDPDLRFALEKLLQATLAAVAERDALQGKPSAQAPALNARLPYRDD